MTVDPNKLDEIVAAVEKQYGKDKLHLGSAAQKIPRIPFPSLELNIATGGGLPLGKISRFYGNYSGGKSLAALNLIKNAQNLNIIAEKYLESQYDEIKERGEDLLARFPDGLTCAYYNVEKVWDKVHAENVGIDTDKVLVVEGSLIEPLATIVEASLGAIHVHVIDSVSAAASVDEVSSDIEDWHRAIKARVWSKVLDHWQEHLDMTDNAIVLIDQVRIDQMTGAHTAPGGEKIEHASSQTLYFKRGKWLFDKEGVLKPEQPKSGDTVHGTAEPAGYEANVSVRKSRVGRPFRKAQMKIRLNPGPTRFDTTDEYLNAAVWLGVVEKSGGGGWVTLPDGEKVQGSKKFNEYVEENPEFKRRIEDEVDLYCWRNP
jgi:recombination protein RecA